jgi:RNA polymerase sigma factor (sigma-70 family)
MDEQRSESPVIAGPDLHTALAHYLQDTDDYRKLYGILRQMAARSGLVPAGDDAALRELCDELLQTVVGRAYELAAREPAPRANIRAWLFRIAANVIKEFRRQRRLEQQRIVPIGQIMPREREDDEAFFTLFSRQIATADPTQQVELREELQEALSRLSADDRRILSLCWIYGLQYQEIANLLKISPGAARVRHSRALKRLQATWKAQHEQRRGERHG